MKRLLLVTTLVLTFALGALAQSDSTDIVPDYGIEVFNYEVEQRLPDDTTTMRHEVTFNSMRFLNNKVVFYYKVESYNDSVLVNSVKQLEVVLNQKELNVELQGQKIYDWIGGLYSPQDSNVIRALTEIAYKYKVIGNN